MSVSPRRRRGLSVAVLNSAGRCGQGGIAGWLHDGDHRVTIVGSYRSAAALLRDHPVVDSEVDLVVAVLGPHRGGPGVDAVRLLTAAGHRVMVCSGEFDAAMMLACFSAGVVTYVAGPRGRPGPAGSSRAGAARPELTSREREVLIAWCHTTTKLGVGEKLAIERATVSSHLQRIRAKYAAAGRPAPTKAALIARAIQDGLVDVEDL